MPRFNTVDFDQAAPLALPDFVLSNWPEKTGHLLDKLETTAESVVNQTLNYNFDIYESLQKYQVSKMLSNTLTNELLKVVHSKKLYIRMAKTIDCLNVLNNENLDMKRCFCKNRNCLTCNRVAAGKYINKYGKAVENFDSPRFLTLTVVNPPLEKLEKTLNKMYHSIRAIKENLRYQKIEVKGIRKLEVTFNAEKNTYHPHFHLITNSEEANFEFRRQWLEHFKDAEPWCQDDRPAEKGELNEIFKYFTKISTKSSSKSPNFYLSPVCMILDHLQGRRLVQPFGVRAEKIEAKKFKLYNVMAKGIFVWNGQNWVNTVTKKDVISSTVPSYCATFGKNFIYKNFQEDEDY